MNGDHKSKFVHIKVEMSLGIGERMSNRQMVYELKYRACIYKFVLHLLMGITEVVSMDDI